MKLNRWQRKKILGMTEREFNNYMDAICALRHKRGVYGYILQNFEWEIKLEAEKKAEKLAEEMLNKRAAEKQTDILNDFQKAAKVLFLLFLGGLVSSLLL